MVAIKSNQGRKYWTEERVLKEAHKYHSISEFSKKCSGAYDACFFVAFLTQPDGDKASRTHAERKAASLNYGHYRENDADCRTRVCSELRHEKCVRHVVKRCHEHGCDCRDGKLCDELPYRRVHHLVILFVCKFCFLFHLETLLPRHCVHVNRNNVHVNRDERNSSTNLPE